jgi:hypothetical protein
MTLPSFINKGQPKTAWPDWLLKHAVGRPDDNGSFMIRTKIGKDEDLRARVHKGAIVFERNGIAYTRADADEARRFIAELDEIDRQAYKDLPNRGGEGGEADIADMSDDTDDITRKLGGEVPPAPKPKPFKMRIVNPPKPKSAGRKFAAPKGNPPSIEMRNPGELRIDDSYQRSIDTGPSRALINRIANDWDWRMCLPLVVSKRDDGYFYVIDGQHRLAASNLRSDIPFLPCCVFVFENVAEEAKMFVAMNRARRAVNRLDDFHAAQASGNEDALAIKGLIEAVGFTVSRKTGSGAWAPGEVAFTSAIAKARRRYGDRLVMTALEIMAEAFKGERLVVGSPVFTGICGMLGDTELNPDRARLLAGVRTLDMPGWASLIAECRGGTDRNKHIRDFLLAAYSDAEVAE